MSSIRVVLAPLMLTCALLFGGCVQLTTTMDGCCSSPCGGPRSDRLADSLRAYFFAMWEAYKKARVDGRMATRLAFHPPGHSVRVLRDGEVRLLTRNEAEIELAQRREVRVEDIDGPHLIFDPCGCGTWVVGKLRVVVVRPGSSSPVTEEESYRIAGSSTSPGDWRMVASQNGIEDPRRPSSGTVIRLP